MLNDNRVQMWLRYWRCWAAGVLATAVLSCLTCSLFNKAPSVPVITGPTAGYPDSIYAFSAVAVDPDGDRVRLRFDWGDGDTSEWSELQSSGKQVSTSHSWSTLGSYEVRAQARDYTGAESKWSASRTVGIVDFDFPYRIVAAIPTSDEIYSMAPSRDGNFIYVGHRWASLVSVIDTRENQVVKEIAMGPFHGQAPRSLVVLPGGDRVYATYYYLDRYVAVIRTADNTVVDSVSQFDSPEGIVVTPDGGHVYVTGWVSPISHSSIAVLRTSDNVVVDTIAGEENEFYELAMVPPDGRYLYASGVGMQGYYVCRIRTSDNALVDTITGLEPTRLAVSPDGRYLYAVDCLRGRVLVFETSDNAPVDTIAVPEAQDLTVTPDGRYIYATGQIPEGGVVVIVRAADNAMVQTLTIPGNHTARAVAASPTGDRIFVAVDTTVYVLGR